MEAAFTSELDENLFVFYGSLRSGTTLMRLMFDAHPEISCPGERDFMFDYLGHRQDYDPQKLATDRIFQSAELTLPQTKNGIEAFQQMLAEDRAKSPKQIYVLILHRGLEAAMQAMPNAKFIHLLRDPRDVARSSIGMGWAGNTWYGVNHWLTTEQQWDQAITPERAVLNLRYEDLLDDPKGVLTRVCGFLGVSFDPRMLTYDQNSTYSQVDASLSYQWRRKQSPTEVSELEFKLGDLLVDKGYETSAAGPVQPTRLRLLQLLLQNKRAIWRNRVKRYGLFDPVWDTCTRRLGLNHLATKTRQRMNERDKAYLK